MEFYVFYEWHGMSRRSFSAPNMKEAAEKAKILLRSIEPADDPICWAYVVAQKAGEVIRCRKEQS